MSVTRNFHMIPEYASNLFFLHLRPKWEDADREENRRRKISWLSRSRPTLPVLFATTRNLVMVRLIRVESINNPYDIDYIN